MAQSTPESPATLYVARQPILDERGELFGYELLYRRAPGDETCTLESDLARASAITIAMLNLGLDTLTGGQRAFLNVTGPMVIERIDALVPPRGVVLELLETIEVTDAFVAACRRLKAKGYALALDDFVVGSPAEALLPYVSFVKVDVLSTPMPEVIDLAKRLTPLGVTMLAEKIEDRDVYARTREAGYTLFQGYYFCKPVIQTGTAIPAHQMVYIRLIAALSQPDLTVTELEALVKQDVSLSLRVLRFANSAAVPIKTEVGSIRQALLVIGIEPIRKWASVWCLAELNPGSIPELTTIALVRARTCELVGEQSRFRDASEYFVVGLFSLLDALLNRSMADAVGYLTLPPSTTAALLGSENRKRAVLDAVIAYENGSWDEASEAAARAGVDPSVLPAAYTSALQWAQDISSGGMTASRQAR